MLLRRARTFRRLWIGQSVSVIGDGMQRIALLWWAKHHGGNALLAAIALSTVVPVVAGSPIGGWLADRADRRRLLLGADLVRLGSTSTLAVLLFGGNPSSVVVCALVVVAGFATSVFDPTYATAVPSVVAEVDLPAANGLNMANGAIGGLAGPLLGGVLIGVFDLGWVMVINAATFAWSAGCIASIRLPQRPGALVDEGADAATPSPRRTLSLVRSDRRVVRLVGLGSVVNMVVAPVPMLIVALAVDRFHTGAAAFGLLEIMVSVGILIGALTAPRLARGPIAAPLLVMGSCIVAAGSLPLIGSAGAFVLLGIAVAVANTSIITMLQLAVPDEMRGRVFGVVGALGEGLRPAGLALGAPLLAAGGVRGAFAVVGGCVVLATLAWGRIGAPIAAAPSAGGVAALAAVALDGEAYELVDEG